MPEKHALNPALTWGCRFIGSASLALAFIYVLNNFLTYGYGLAGPTAVFSGGATVGSFLQLALVVACLGAAFWFTRRPSRLGDDAAVMDTIASKTVAVAFWAVLIVGVADGILSFLRVEGLHEVIFGYDIATKISISTWRGTYVHIPLMLVALVLGLRDRSVSVVWLIFLVVIAELLIVIARFVFAYEQTFMADMVRFWYAALFLFASAFTLKEEGHVRVDVIFAGFRERTKAWVNATGTAFFGIPLCWVVIWRGLSGKTSTINAPVLSFETTMTGFGMYVKYMMAAFLLVFALSMLAQFTAYLFSALSVLNGETPPEEKEA